MKRHFILPFAMLVLTQSGGVGEWAAAVHAQTVEAKTEGDLGLHLMVAVQGSVSLKRRVWHNYAPAVFGTPLVRGDLLRVEASSRAKIVCSDLTVHEVTSGITGIPCSDQVPPIIRIEGQLADPPRGLHASTSFPKIISPRQTKLLSPHPMLRWSPVEGATVYTIRVRGVELDQPMSVRSNTGLHYPPDALPLKRGTYYKLIVEANGRSSEEEPGMLGRGFSILDPREAAAMRRKQERIRGLGLDIAATELVTAHLFATNSLNTEAIEHLEPLARSLKEPVIARLVGSLYLATGLPREAEVYYLLALEWSTTRDDDMGQALAHEKLAHIYMDVVGNWLYAEKHLRAAILQVKKVDDHEWQRRLTDALAKIELKAR